jgi:hypothetical protein
MSKFWKRTRITEAGHLFISPLFPLISNEIRIGNIIRRTLTEPPLFQLLMRTLKHEKAFIALMTTFRHRLHSQTMDFIFFEEQRTEVLIKTDFFLLL